MKKGEDDRLKEKQEEARIQIEEYINFDEIRDIENLHKYIVVAINDKIYVERV